MGFFKKRKNKNKEEINLKIDTITEDIFLEEKNDEVKEEVVEVKTYEQLQEEVLYDFQVITTKNIRMIKEYYICKIFSRCMVSNFLFYNIIKTPKNIH